jgi:hypothetical protein
LLSNNIVQQKLERKPVRKQLDWKDDPTFAGLPGHNLDENYNPRPKAEPGSYHDPDFDDMP